jgi:mannose-6-phosphate isomerase-like protein (cupin superfamily)
VADRTISRFDAVDWHVPSAPGTDPAEAADAGDRGAGRKLLAQGDQGFYVQVVQIPPDFEAPAHAHDHPEVFMVLDGSCVFDGEAMRRYDMTVIGEGEPYGFTSGPEGVRFLVVRTGAANYAKVSP